MTEASNNVQHVAVHEAGHAVIARVLDMACGGATIVPDEDEFAAGHAETFDPHTTAYAWERRGHFREMRSVFVGRIITFMAGAAAEEELLGRCEGVDSDDRFQIALMLAEIGGDEALEHRLETRLRRMARMLCKRHRTAIRTVANALSTHNTLDAESLWTVSAVKRPPDVEFWAETYVDAASITATVRKK